MSESIPSLIGKPHGSAAEHAMDAAPAGSSRRSYKGPGPMLISMVLVAVMAVLLAGVGSAIWVTHSLRAAAMRGALSAQTTILEYAGRTLISRVEQQQKMLHGLAVTLAEHFQAPKGDLENIFHQSSSLMQQYAQIQLADVSGGLLTHQQENDGEPVPLLQERQREILKRALFEGKPMTLAWVASGATGPQLEFQSAVPVRNAQGRLQGVVGATYRTPLPVLVQANEDSAGGQSQFMLIDHDLQPLALSRQGRWQLSDAKLEMVVPSALDPTRLKIAQWGVVSVQREGALWSAMPLPWSQWTLLSVSDAQEWLPGVSVRMLGGGVALLLLALLLGGGLCLMAYPLTALFRDVEKVLPQSLTSQGRALVHGRPWWSALSDQDWGEARALRTALQELGRAGEVWGAREHDLQMQLQTLMDYAPIGLAVTHGKKVLRAGLPVARVLGYQPHEMSGLAVRELCATAGDYGELMRRIHGSLNTYGQFESEVRLIRKDGRLIWVRIHGQSLQRMRRSWGHLGPALDERYLLWELEDVTALRQVRKQSGWKAMHDPLTGLPNRKAFALRLQEWLHEQGKEGVDDSELSPRSDRSEHATEEAKVNGVVLYVDLDHFSQVNRQGGREVGDEVLRHIARLIEVTVRPYGWVARVGGDEFAVLMAGVSREEGMRHAQLLCMAIQDWDGSYQERRYMLSASIGMLLLDTGYHTAASAFKGADMACDAAKCKGRNRVEVMAASV